MPLTVFLVAWGANASNVAHYKADAGHKTLTISRHNVPCGKFFSWSVSVAWIVRCHKTLSGFYWQLCFLHLNSHSVHFQKSLRFISSQLSFPICICIPISITFYTILIEVKCLFSNVFAPSYRVHWCYYLVIIYWNWLKFSLRCL